MNTLNLFYQIKEAFETSTHNTNRFKKFLESIKWDSTFEADVEFYFNKNDFCFTTPSLDPFNMKWEASGTWDDGTTLTI